VLGASGRRLVGVVVALGLCVAWSVPASAATFTSHLGTVTATLTYQGTSSDPHHTTLIVTNAGRVVYRAAVSTPLCATSCVPEAAYYPNGGNPLRVVRLEPGSPDVVLGLYSGGAHCCFADLVLEPLTASRYVATTINLGDPGARLQTLDGNPFVALVTADDSFAYAFTDYAASGLPVRILRVQGHRALDVTRQYPSMIRSDASRWLAAFYAQASSHYDDSVGVMAAWAADEYLLGQRASADRFLSQQAAAGHLNSLLNPTLKAFAYVQSLETFLVQRGY